MWCFSLRHKNVRFPPNLAKGRQTILEMLLGFQDPMGVWGELEGSRPAREPWWPTGIPVLRCWPHVLRRWVGIGPCWCLENSVGRFGVHFLDGLLVPLFLMRIF